MKQNRRLDHTGEFRTAFEKNRRKVLATQKICGICGRPVDFELKYPDPMSATVDHIIPIDRGGHPSALENLQLAHLACNREKSNKLTAENKIKEQVKPTNTNRDLPWSMDWRSYRAVK